MTNVVRFQPARLCLLRATGELVDVVAEPSDAEGLRYLTISRAFCRHLLFRAPPGAGRSAAANAARMHAEMHCPFSDGDWLLTPVSGGVATWWWDARAVRSLIGDRWAYDAAMIVPETLQEPPGEGWRQMVTADGYDLQCWSAGVLQASFWRRQAFDQAAWSTLALGLPAGVTLPEEIPAPEGLKLDPVVRRPRPLPRDLGWRDVTRGAVAAAALALIVSGWFSGRAIALDRATEDATARAVAWSDSGGAQHRAVGQRMAALRTIAALSAAPDPVPAVVAAFGVLNDAGTSAHAWRVDREGLRLALAERPTRASPRDVAAALERDPLFAGVSAQRDGDTGMVFEAALETPRGAKACASC